MAIYPRIVAVVSTIPIHGALVFVQMSPISDCHLDDSEAGGDGGDSVQKFQQYRICQAVLDADIQWCATKITTLSLCPQLQQQRLSQHVAFSPSKAIPLCANILTAYASPDSLPRRFERGTLPIKLRNSAGHELSINWPFVRGPKQEKEDFENTIKDILIVNIGISATSSPSLSTTSSLASASPLRGCNLLTSIINKDFGDYEVAVALESHRVFKFDEEGSRIDHDCSSNSQLHDTPSSLSIVPPSSIAPPVLPSHVITPKIVKGDGNICDNAESRMMHVSNSSFSPSMDDLFCDEDEDKDEEEMEQTAPCRRTTSGATRADSACAQPGQKRSIHDILMGEDSDSDEECGGEAIDEMLRKEDYDYLNNNLDTVGEYHQEYHQRYHNIAGSGSNDGDNTTNAYSANIENVCGISHGGDVGSSSSSSSSSDAVASLAGGGELQVIKAEIAAQICFAEWEADYFFSNMSKENVKLHIVRNQRDDPNEDAGE